MDEDVCERLARELARRLNTLLPENLRMVEGLKGSIHLMGPDGGFWGGVDLNAVDAYETVESLAEYALSSLQDDVAHAVNGAWPPVGAPRLNEPWVRRQGDSVWLGFDGGIDLEPIPLADLEATV